MIAARIAFRRAIAEKRAAKREQFFRGITIQGGPLGLVVGDFVPIDAEPPEAVDNASNQLGLVPLGIGVFDSQDHRAALFARK